MNKYIYGMISQYIYKSNNKIGLFFLLTTIIILFSLMGLNAHQYEYERNLICIMFGGAMFVYYNTIRSCRFDFFHPIHIYMFFYICIFFITPIFLIDIGEEKCMGVDIMSGCIKATFIVLLGLMAFCLGYKNVKTSEVQLPVRKLNEKIERKILRTSYVIFIIIYIISLGYAMRSGKTLASIFSLGTLTYTRIYQDTGDQLLFLINVSYSLLIPWLFICVYGKSKLVKLLTSFLLFSLFVSYGWRFIIYIMILGYLIVHTRISGKKIKFVKIFLLGVILILYSTIQGAIRNDIRSGNKADFEGFSMENIAYTLKSNFNIYQPFYAVADKYPSQYDFYYGQSCFVYPIIMWIPRFIWKDKPLGKDYPNCVATKKAINESAITDAAFSYPNIFEYYIDFGTIGVLFISYILGCICKKMLRRYNSSSTYDIIIYAIFIGFLIQFINRGNLSQLMTLLFFLFIPIRFYRKYFIKFPKNERYQ